MKADEFCTPRPKPVPRKPKARKRLPARSKKNAAAQPVLADARRACLDRDNYRCRRCGELGTNDTLAAHHIKRRSQGGQHVVENLLTLHHHCHRWVHDNPAESKANGWLEAPHYYEGERSDG